MEKLFKNFKNGRPKKFKSVKKLQNIIDKYFKSCFEEYWIDVEMRDNKGNLILDDKKTPLREPRLEVRQKKSISISGMCVSIGCTRKTLIIYENDDKFRNTIETAKAFIEQNVEDGVLDGRINAQGGIFNLKNNFGWKDKTEVENTMKVEGVKEINYIKPAQIEKPHDQNAAPVVSPVINFEKSL